MSTYSPLHIGGCVCLHVHVHVGGWSYCRGAQCMRPGACACQQLCVHVSAHARTGAAVLVRLCTAKGLTRRCLLSCRLWSVCRMHACLQLCACVRACVCVVKTRLKIKCAVRAYLSNHAGGFRAHQGLLLCFCTASAVLPQVSDLRFSDVGVLGLGGPRLLPGVQVVDHGVSQSRVRDHKTFNDPAFRNVTAANLARKSNKNV